MIKYQSKTSLCYFFLWIAAVWPLATIKCRWSPCLLARLTKMSWANLSEAKRRKHHGYKNTVPLQYIQAHMHSCVQLPMLSACSLEQITWAHQSQAACLLPLCIQKSPLLLFMEVAQWFDPSHTVQLCIRCSEGKKKAECVCVITQYQGCWWVVLHPLF